MQVILNIESAQLQDSVSGLLESLSVDEKKDLAKQVMLAWLREPADIERITEERRIITEAQENNRKYGHRVESEEEIRKGYSFPDKLKGFRSTREKMIDSIRAQIAQFCTEQVKASIEADPRIRLMLDELIVIIKDMFPKMAHDAMMLMVIANMSMATRMGVEGVFGNLTAEGQRVDLNQEMRLRLEDAAKRVGLIGGK